MKHWKLLMKLTWIKFLFVSYLLVACSSGGGGAGTEGIGARGVGEGFNVAAATGNSDDGSGILAVGGGDPGGQPSAPTVPGPSVETVWVHVSLPGQVENPSGRRDSGKFRGFYGNKPYVNAWQLNKLSAVETFFQKPDQSETTDVGGNTGISVYFVGRGGCHQVLRIQACYFDGENYYLSESQNFDCSLPYDYQNPPQIHLTLQTTSNPMECPPQGPMLNENIAM